MSLAVPSPSRMPAVDNPLLTAVARRARAGRTPFAAGDEWFAIPEKVRGGRMVRAWFATKGCTWDRSGACTMCNYGHSDAADDGVLLGRVRAAIEAASVPTKTLFLGPSGSLLDSREVPVAVRRAIYALVSKLPIEELSTETRPELVNDGVIRELASALPHVRLAVGMGLESASAWVQRFCINKQGSPERFADAAEVLRAHGVAPHMNVIVGAPFLSDVAAVDDAVASVSWAIDHDAELVVLFPLHVRPFTVVSLLHEAGLYQPPSLWSLVEVLRQLGPDRCRRVQISWFRDYYGNRSSVIAMPTTCRRCREAVVGRLADYRDTWEYAVVDELVAMSCPCKYEWRARMEQLQTNDLVSATLEAYTTLAAVAGLDAEWRGWRDTTAGAMLSALDAGVAAAR